MFSLPSENIGYEEDAFYMNKITLTIPGYPHAISFIQETTQGQQKPVSAVESNPSISTDNYKTFSIYQKYFEAKSHEYYRKTNILHTDRMFLAYQNKLSAEGFLGTAKEIVKKAIRFAIMIIKNLINWVRGFIIAFARFVRDKIIYRVFGRPKSQKELEYYGAAYDQYCNLPISWTGDEEKSTEAQDESKRQGNLYTRHGNTPISYTNANKDIPELSPQERENLRYMHFKNDNFDTINRVSAVTAHAAASIQTSLLNDIKNFEKKKNVYRNYGIPYGNKELEATYRAEKD
jgi:hypothetical protein